MPIDLSRHRSLRSMRNFYNRFFLCYPVIEVSVDSILKEVMERWIAPMPGLDKKSAIDYACGSGSLSLQLRPYFGTVEGRDNAGNMLMRARRRARRRGLDIAFRQGNLLAIEEADNSFDRVFISFGLHLFSPEQIESILRRLLAVARESVMIIDHPRRRRFSTAFIEWLEGSYYVQFITMDFAGLAGRIGAGSFSEEATDGAMVLVFGKKSSPERSSNGDRRRS